MSDKIPALDRGLQVLNFMVQSGGSCQYSELKQLIEGITDASLNRLLKALIASDYIDKDGRGRYQLTSKVRGWVDYLHAHAGWREKVESCVRRLSESTHESVAMGCFDGERIEILASHCFDDTLSIMRPGGTLHFEADHAGALSILSLLSEKDQKALLSSELSKIATHSELKSAIGHWRREGYFNDESSERLGVCRLAVGFEWQNRIFTLFYCLTTMQRDQAEEILVDKILKAVQDLMHE